MIDDAEAWVDDCLADAGAERTGPLAVFRRRAWADIYRAPTSVGTVWLKATTPDTAAEVRLYETLHRVVPDRVLRPLGIEPDRGWLLLPDGGVSAGDTFTPADLTIAMTRAVRQYADLQRALAPSIDTMLSAGVADMRPAVMPRRFDEAMAGAAGYVAAAGSAEERAGYDRLLGLRDTYVAWCRELAASPIAASIDHNDLHAWNVIGVGPPVTFEARFWDWGDSVVAHPFASLLFVLDTMPAEDGPQLQRSYLTAFGDPAELAPVADLAVRVAQVARALVWQRALGAADHDHEHAGSRVENLLRLLD